MTALTNPVRDNPAQSRYELEVDGAVAFARYRREGGLLVISYVEAPPALRGTGAAARLMEGVMDIARAEKLKVRPLCSYAATWIRRHSKTYGDMVA